MRIVKAYISVFQVSKYPFLVLPYRAFDDNCIDGLDQHRSAQVCAAFCGADSVSGACNGFGICSDDPSAGPMCACNSGYHRGQTAGTCVLSQGITFMLRFIQAYIHKTVLMHKDIHTKMHNMTFTLYLDHHQCQHIVPCKSFPTFSFSPPFSLCTPPNNMYVNALYA